MFQRKKLHLAVLSAIAATTAPHASAELEEIVVTATKRAVPLQDAPVTIQAIGSKELEDQNIQEFADYVQYLPNVNAGGRGPGQNEIYIRGAAVDAINITVAESQGSAPNVALYLDEQPVTAGGRNLDVYISDMERIEVLPGPRAPSTGPVQWRERCDSLLQSQCSTSSMLLSMAAGLAPLEARTAIQPKSC